MAKITRRASPSRGKLSNPARTANQVASKAVEASPRRTSEENNSWVAAMIIRPEELEIVVVATTEEPLTTTSKFSLIGPNKGGAQREGKDLSFQAKICLSMVNKI
jgi:hypothetical protein